MKQPIIIVDYNPQWPAMFEKEKERILASIGQWVKAIEHIGSTAVSGLSSKPVIDIMIGVHTLAEADAHCVKRIEQLGYHYVPEYEKELPQRRYFRKVTPDGTHTHHIHLVEIDSEFWEHHLLFRDYLRAHQHVAQEYAQLKRMLSAQCTDCHEYTDAKTEFINKIMHKAQQWKKATMHTH